MSACGTWAYGGSALHGRGSFEGILARIYTSFEENHRKLRTAKSTSVIGVLTRHFPTISFEVRTALQLVGLLQEWYRILHLLINSPIDSISQMCSTLLAVWENRTSLLKTFSFKKTTTFFFHFFSYAQ